MKRVKKRINKENTIKIKESLNIGIILASLIDQAGVKAENVEEYINPKYEHLHSPFLFRDMEKAVDRILKAVEENEKILIYGDYDADGNTATAILMHFFNTIKYTNVEYMIPNRLIDGYGMSISKVEEIVNKEVKLVITVDCGIKNINEVEELNKNGIDTILTDHHEQGESIPSAFAVINPKVKKEKYPYKDLAGAGVSLKLALAINEKMGKKLSEDKIKELMLIASIGTIADVMPLNGENRDIIKIALKDLDINKMSAGIKNLVISHLPLSEENIAYYIVPKINASGRLGKELAIKLLIETDEKKAQELSEKLDILNEERKNITESQFLELDKIVQDEKIYLNEFIFVGKENLHEGIIGIISAKISEKYKKPVAVYTNKREKDDEMVASARCSEQDVNIYNLLESMKELFLGFGGHDYAAGFSFKKENEEKIRDLTSSIKPKKEEKVLKYNNNLNISEIDIPLIKSMDVLRPYGNKNEEPVFLFKNLEVKQIFEYPKLTRIIFSQKVGHRTNLKTNEKIIVEDEITAISFKTKEELGIELNKKIDVYATLSINAFRGIEKIQLRI